ncbi:UNVERIFIED_CONTAM: hypothetical protein FKN15_035745 [Acipenser sinensis]
MKCLREKGQGPRIDQYFLRSQSSQSNEIQRQEANHSSQDISTPVIDVRRTCMDTVSDEPNDPCEPEHHYSSLYICLSQYSKVDLCVQLGNSNLKELFEERYGCSCHEDLSARRWRCVSVVCLPAMAKQIHGEYQRSGTTLHALALAGAPNNNENRRRKKKGK